MGQILYKLTILSYFLFAPLTAKANIEQPLWLNTFFDALGPCDLQDLSLPLEFKKDLFFEVTKNLNQKEIDQLADEMTWGGASAKMYYPRPTVNRQQTEQTFMALGWAMKQFNIHEVNLILLQAEANKRLTLLKKNKMLGDCYTIQHREHPLLGSKRSVPLTFEVQQQIDQLFIQPQNFRLTSQETDLLRRQELTVPEIRELRAIRKATEIFENNTILKQDMAGGFWSNVRAELFGDNQLVCTDEAETYLNFLQVLQQRHLLQYFAPDGLISMHPSFEKDWIQSGHQATKLINTRTKRTYVLDSWYEAGGQAAHLLSEEDWRQLPVIAPLRQMNFNDTVGLNP